MEQAISIRYTLDMEEVKRAILYYLDSANVKVPADHHDVEWHFNKDYITLFWVEKS